MKCIGKCPFLPLIVLILIAGTAGGQATKDPNVFKLPEENRLIFVSFQPESEVQFKSIEVVVRKGQKIPLLVWALTNKSSKSVWGVHVDFMKRTNVPGWSARGGGSGYEIGPYTSKDIVMAPYGDYSVRSDHSDSPLPPEIQKDFELDPVTGDMRYIVVYARIRKVFFSDGSVYESRKEWYPEYR